MKNFSWDRVWRSSGITFAVLLVVSYLIRGTQPEIGASADTLSSFYSDDRSRVLLGTFLLAFNLLNVLWFAAALSSDLREAGQGIWASAATTASAVMGGLFLVLVTINAGLAYSVVGTADETLTSALNEVAWAGAVLIHIPTAMLVMAGSFGLWKAGVISNGVFGVGVAVVLLVLAGSTTWASDGIWAPDGSYARIVSPLIGIVWIAVLSAILTQRSPTTVRVPDSQSAVATATM